MFTMIDCRYRLPGRFHFHRHHRLPAMGLPDPRSEGSRNPGATNVLRFGGKKAAAITLAGDFLKGVLPVLLARLAGLERPGWR